MNWAAIIWFGLLLGFLILEAACPIHLVSIWFAAGSLVAMIIAFLHGPVWLQITLFLIISCALVALLWPFIKKFLNPHLKKTNIDAIIGKTALVTEEIDNAKECGEVRVGGLCWSARSAEGDILPVGVQVTVLAVDGVKLIVK